MALPDLCLAPHEIGDLAPGEPLCAPATHTSEFRSWFCKRRFLARPVLETAQRTQWVLREHGKSDAPLLLAGQADAFRTEYSDVVENPSHNPKWALSRKIYVDADAKLITKLGEWHRCLWISAVGQTYWVRGEAGCRFAWRPLEHANKFPRLWWAHTSSAQIASEVTALLSNANSQCLFAWQWIDRARQEKNKRLFLVKFGSLEQCEKVVRAVVWSETLEPGNGGEGLQIVLVSGFSRSTKMKLQNMETEVRGFMQKGHCREFFSERQLHLLRIIYDAFGLHYNGELARQHLDHRVGTSEDFNWEIPVPTPSYHEKLEAQLLLRNFLKDKVSPAELRELMGQ